MAMTMKGWFRAIAAAFPSEATAQSFAGISILMLTIYTGKSLSHTNGLLTNFPFRIHYPEAFHDRSTALDHLYQRKFNF